MYRDAIYHQCLTLRAANSVISTVVFIARIVESTFYQVLDCSHGFMIFGLFHYSPAVLWTTLTISFSAR